MLVVVLRNETGLFPLFHVVGYYVKPRKFRCQRSFSSFNEMATTILAILWKPGLEGQES